MDTSHVHLSVTRPPCVGSYQIKFSSFRGWLICNLGRAQCARYSLEFLNIDIDTTPIQTIFRESAYKYIPLIESAYLGFHNLWMGVWTSCLYSKLWCLSTAGGNQGAISEFIEFNVFINSSEYRNWGTLATVAAILAGSVYELSPRESTSRVSTCHFFGWLFKSLQSLFLVQMG